MKFYFATLLILLVSVCSFGQRKSTPKPIIKTESTEAVRENNSATQKVVVEKTNGDKITGLFLSADTESIKIEISGAKVPIQLSEIRLLKFNEVEESVSKNPQSQNSVLNVEAAVIYRSGEVVPVARTTFALLDDDLVTILREAGVRPTASTSRIYTDYGKAIMADIGFSARYGSLPDYQKFSSDLAAAVRSHVKYTFQTDFSGKASLTGVLPGKYYLFGIGSTRKSGVVWNLAIDTTTTSNVTLDANNAAFAY